MIEIKSNKKLRTPERVFNEGIITRKVDFFQINPNTNELTLRITETCKDDKDNVIWETTFTPAVKEIDIQILQPIYNLFAQNLKNETEKERLFGCEKDDFDIIV